MTDSPDHRDAHGDALGDLDGDMDGDRAGDVDDAAARFLADSRVEDRVAERRRTRWLNRQAAESTTFASLLVNLAEIGQPITLRGKTGTDHEGLVRVLGEDVVALAGADAALTLIALAHVVALHHVPGPQATALTAHRPAVRDRPTMRQLLAELADDEPEAICTMDGGATLRGRLRWVGEDLAAMSPLPPEGRVSAGGAAWSYVRLSSLSVVSVRLSALSVSG
ncbi:MAG: hypothetical protein ACKV2O_05635 [Acidimicrobiales bacterium]